jgi:hypothetical protein
MPPQTPPQKFFPALNVRRDCGSIALITTITTILGSSPADTARRS